MENAPQKIVGAVDAPKRHRFWSELTLDERVERLRGELKRVSLVCDNLAEIVAKQRDQLECHRHAMDGMPMVPIVNRHRETGSRERYVASGDDVFM